MSFQQELISVQEKLNSSDFLPAKAYRRNTRVYELVCYVNNITGCYLSGNLGSIGIFIERANLFMEEYSSAEVDDYYSLVKSYLKMMDKVIDESRVQ